MKFRAPSLSLPADRAGQHQALHLALALREQQPGIKVIGLTAYADGRSVVEALRAGARGCLTKDAGGPRSPLRW